MIRFWFVVSNHKSFLFPLTDFAFANIFTKYKAIFEFLVHALNTLLNVCRMKPLLHSIFNQLSIQNLRLYHVSIINRYTFESSEQSLLHQAFLLTSTESLLYKPSRVQFSYNCSLHVYENGLILSPHILRHLLSS